MTEKEVDFIQTVKDHYRKFGRRSLPWRRVRDPYHILISEIMLQQTQVDRVVPKYNNFIQLFPTVKDLANASLGNVLRAWQGLGYNRRAKMLHECAYRVVTHYRGVFPKERKALQELPGVGPYTAGAILAFAFNKPIPIIETNIRSVYIHHFFNDDTDVSDAELMLQIEKTLDVRNPRAWYAALMDYGTHVKKVYGNPNSKSKHYAKQTTFKGSDRQVRGALVKLLSAQTCTRAQCIKVLPFEDVRIDAQLEKLLREELIQYTKGKYHLPE